MDEDTNWNDDASAFDTDTGGNDGNGGGGGGGGGGLAGFDGGQ